MRVWKLANLNESYIGSIDSCDKGGHYSVINYKDDEFLQNLKNIFPDGKANEMNFVLFSTSGVHGSYATLEDIEKEWEENGINLVTALLIQPRLVSIHWGNIEIKTKKDLKFLKKLRNSSKKAISKIGY